MIGILTQIEPGATTNYHGLLLSLEQRTSHGVTASANYTWSHCIGDYADLDSEGPNENETIQIPPTAVLIAGIATPIAARLSI